MSLQAAVQVIGRSLVSRSQLGSFVEERSMAGSIAQESLAKSSRFAVTPRNGKIPHRVHGLASWAAF